MSISIRMFLPYIEMGNGIIIFIGRNVLYIDSPSAINGLPYFSTDDFLFLKIWLESGEIT